MAFFTLNLGDGSDSDEIILIFFELFNFFL